MSKKQRKTLTRIGITVGLFAPLLAAEHLIGWEERLALPLVVGAYLIPYLIIGYDVLYRAIRNIRNGQVFDENFLMAIATVAAFLIGEYSESLAVMLFYQIGEFFQDRAVEKSRASIAHMMELAPERAWLEAGGEVVEADPEDVSVGDIIVVRPGEKIPLDGIVIEGESFLDTSALTGESAPVQKSTGDEVISGCVNGEGTLRIRVTKAYEDSTVALILDLVENASEKKATLENFITRFARYYTPIVTISAAALAILPPLFFAQAPTIWIRRACIFLIVSCPCALVISVPLGFFCGIAAGSRIGVLVKGSNYLESLARVSAFAFDKTGTITEGFFKVIKTVPAADSDCDENEILALAAEAESYSNHPIARSIVDAAKRDSWKAESHVDRSIAEVSTTATGRTLSQVREIPGHGVSAVMTDSNGEVQVFLVGNERLMTAEDIAIPSNIIDALDDMTAVYVALGGTLLGAIVLGDEIRKEAADALARLKKAGIRRTIMFTGDHEEVAARTAKKIGLDDYRAKLLPQDKVACLEETMERFGYTAFVGDGINDAPVLMRSDVGFAMGAMGSDAAIEAADIVLMHDDLMRLPQILLIAKKTTRIVKENIVFAIVVKLIVLLLGAVGLASMWAAVFADVGVAVLAILNAMRSGRV